MFGGLILFAMEDKSRVFKRDYSLKIISNLLNFIHNGYQTKPKLTSRNSRTDRNGMGHRTDAEEALYSLIVSLEKDCPPQIHIC